MAGLRGVMHAVVVPAALVITLEAVHGSLDHHFDDADLLDRDRQQAVIHARDRRIDLAAAALLADIDRSRERKHHGPDSQLRAALQRRLHQTPKPIAAISSGIRMMDSTKVAFICVFVMLT